MPDIRPDVVGLAGQAAVQPQGDAAARASGRYKGSQVQVIDQQSLLADALEELTSELSEETEKDVSAREVEDGKKAESLERIARLNEVEALLQVLGDLDKKDLVRGLKTLMQQQDAPADQIREQARREFEEPAHQYALLKSYADALRERGASVEEVAAATDALAKLMEDSGPAVRAALNIAETASDFALDDLGDCQSLRDAYRSNVHDYQDMSSVLKDLFERFSEKDLVKSIAFMTKALAADLAAGGPSIDRTRLALIVNDMHRLEAMSTIHDNCGIVMDKAHESGASKSFTATTLLQELVSLQEARWLNGGQITEITQRAGLQGIEPQINFFNDLKDVVRMIPEKSYAREESREKLLNAVQEALDEAITAEDEEEEA